MHGRGDGRAQGSKAWADQGGKGRAASGEPRPTSSTSTTFGSDGTLRRPVEEPRIGGLAKAGEAAGARAHAIHLGRGPNGHGDRVLEGFEIPRGGERAEARPPVDAWRSESPEDPRGTLQDQP